MHRRPLLALAAAIAAVAALAGCAPSAPAQTGGAEEHGTSGSSSSPTAEHGSAAASETPEGETSASQTGAACGRVADDPRIHAAIPSVPAAFTTPEMSDRAWGDLVVATDFDPCAELSVALITVEGATGSSPMQALLFHRGEYLGTTSDCAPAWQSIDASNGQDVSLRYEWPKPGEPNAGAKDSAIVTYTWDPATSSVRMAGALPEQAIDESICHTWPPRP